MQPNNDLNTIKIHERLFILPDDQKTLDSVLNHLQMCLAGKKDFIRLFDLDGAECKITSFELCQADKKGLIDLRQ